MKHIILSEQDNIPVKYLNILKKEGIETVEDLLLCYPNRFEDYSNVPISEVVPEVLVTISGIIQSKAVVVNTKTKLSVMNFYVECDDHKIKVTIFNRHFLKTKIAYGTYVRLTGKMKVDGKTFVASEIHFDEFSNAINPVFNIKKIPDAKIIEFKERAFYKYSDYIEECLPFSMREKAQVIDNKKALQYINIPESMDEIKQSIKRIKFEEMFLYQLKIKYLLHMRKHHPQGVKMSYDTSLVEEFIAKLPFILTIDQKISVEDILYDMSAPYKMNRLLQGEVGSGKTVVAAIALYAAITAGYQGAIMVPTEVLANQHYKTFMELFSNQTFNNEKIRIELLSSSVSGKERKDIIDDLANKKIDILIGTHALFQKDVVFNHLGLVVTDEEHRFGVRQRVSIVGKGYLIDHLKMSATPIPRTLAISVLGESDISVIKTLPGNKKETITKYVKNNDTKIVFDHIKEELSKGHQIYVVAPMIDESDVMDLHNATNIYEKMRQYYEGVCTVGLIHSRLKTLEKEDVMRKFADNMIQILVSTTVIEVGVNIVNATTMIILDADRFGIAQLHQMRGRVRRSDEQAYCFLVSDTHATSAVERLKLVEENNDGFVLAEEDLITRGAGDFFGEKQTGMVPYKMADIILDKDLFELANKMADDCIQSNELFDHVDYKAILAIVHENYCNNKEMLD